MFAARTLAGAALAAASFGLAGGATGDPYHPPTVADAEAFVASAEEELLDLSTKANRASWIQQTYITVDTVAMAALASDALLEATTRLIHQATRFDGLDLPPSLARQLRLLKISLTMPAPSDPALRAELTQVAAGLDADYGRSQYCPTEGPFAGQCLGQSEMEVAFATTREPAALLDLWVGWHRIGAPLRPAYTRLVELSNQGARELGLSDVGALWRSGYDMSPEAFAAETQRLWEQVRPLYESLHAYVRRRLSVAYGTTVVPPDGLIPAHLLGNIWAQSWSNVYDLVAPPGRPPLPDLTELLQARNAQPLDIVRYGENFFRSLGFAPLPETFWERSMFVRPRDRDVVCHASAWDIDSADDLRLKMCIRIDGSSFTTVHHELGHLFYMRAYNTQPYLFRSGANDGFHEAIGDAIALAVTPAYLHRIGLLDEVPPQTPASDIAFLLRRGLDGIAFLPYGLLLDAWRWRVFSGEIAPADYNRAFWDLRRQYQGVSPPVARTEADFDPGAKYHVPGNVPYMRYFLARILEFQFYRAMCREAGQTGPLHQCTFFGSKAAGAKLEAMLEMGQSRPWPDALEALTGTREMDAGALLEYFAPLEAWLNEQNAGAKVGW